MKRLLALARRLGLLESRECFDRRESLPEDLLLIPRGAQLKGELQCNLPVVLAGRMSGALNIQGEGRLLILEGASASGGLLCAASLEVHGLAHDAAIDADRLYVGEKGVIDGQSVIRYERLAKHADAPINGTLRKRKGPRSSASGLPLAPLPVQSVHKD